MSLYLAGKLSKRLATEMFLFLSMAFVALFVMNIKLSVLMRPNFDTFVSFLKYASYTNVTVVDSYANFYIIHRARLVTLILKALKVHLKMKQLSVSHIL
jgi:hypothetical protein